MKTRTSTLEQFIHVDQWTPFLEQQQQEGEPVTPAIAPESPLAAANSPTGADIPVAPANTPKPVEIIQPKPIIKQKGVLNVSEALGIKKKPSEELNEEAAAVKKRNQATTHIPVPPMKKAEKPAEIPAVETKPLETPAAVVPKVKIGDKEMTTEEIAKEMDDLRAKAAKALETPKPAEVKPAEVKEKLTPEQQAEAAKKLDTDTIGKLAPTFALAEDQLDVLLSGGKPAVELFAQIRAQDALQHRKWTEDALNPILKEIFERLDPVAKMHDEVAQYQNETNFYTKFPDLKPYLKHVRNVAEAIKSKYPQEYAKQTQAERDADLETNVRYLMKEGFIAPATEPAPSPNATPAAAKPVVTPTPKAPQPTPPKGQLGQSAVSKATNPQTSLIAKLEASGK